MTDRQAGQTDSPKLLHDEGDGTFAEVIAGVGISANAAGTITRPADTNAYAIGDLIADVTTTSPQPSAIALPVGRVNGGSGMIRALRLKVNDTAFKNATIRAHLFRDLPTFGVGDNGAFNASETYQATESAYMGYVDITLSQQFSDPAVKGFGVRSIGSEWNFDCGAGTKNIFAVLEARSAVTPGSGKIFTLVAEVLQN
jgi:hypothetical protein